MLPSSKTSRCKAITDVSNLNIAWFSDIHTGHANTPTQHICESMMLALPDDSTTADLDMIVLAGDVFERQLTLPEEASGIVKRWITQLLRLCKRHDVVLRVMEGTPSHDWQQSKLFTMLNELANVGTDVRFVNKLEIEYIERFDIHILYVPDELNTHADTTWQQVVQLLDANGLTKVDYAVVHGMFPHQVPQNMGEHNSVHNADRYLSIVKYIIYVGHIHQHSQHDRIIASGSIERLNHGDEIPKGHIRTRGSDWRFVVNKRAWQYVTIECSKLTPEDAHEKIQHRVMRLHKGAHVRIKANRTDPAFVGLEAIKLAYPQFSFTTKETGRPEKNAHAAKIGTPAARIKIGLSRDSIETELVARITAKFPALATTCQQYLREIMNESRS